LDINSNTAKGRSSFDISKPIRPYYPKNLDLSKINSNTTTNNNTINTTTASANENYMSAMEKNCQPRKSSNLGNLGGPRKLSNLAPRNKSFSKQIYTIKNSGIEKNKFNMKPINNNNMQVEDLSFKNRYNETAVKNYSQSPSRRSFVRANMTARHSFNYYFSNPLDNEESKTNANSNSNATIINNLAKIAKESRNNNNSSESNYSNNNKFKLLSMT